jgi:hypothetical protein
MGSRIAKKQRQTIIRCVKLLASRSSCQCDVCAVHSLCNEMGQGFINHVHSPEIVNFTNFATD